MNGVASTPMIVAVQLRDNRPVRARPWDRTSNPAASSGARPGRVNLVPAVAVALAKAKGANGECILGSVEASDTWSEVQLMMITVGLLVLAKVFVALWSWWTEAAMLEVTVETPTVEGQLTKGSAEVGEAVTIVTADLTDALPMTVT